MFNIKGAFAVCLSIFILFLSISKVSAAAQYSYKNTEKLKPLIEWRSYEANTFKEAVRENKPIFILISAPSWCFYCRMYESRDYLFNKKIYPYINKHFIPIYVDSDKRRDLTRRYLQGGWPSTVILRPNGKKIIGWAGVLTVKDMYDVLKKAVHTVNKIRHLKK